MAESKFGCGEIGWGRKRLGFFCLVPLLTPLFPLTCLLFRGEKERGEEERERREEEGGAFSFSFSFSFSFPFLSSQESG